MSRILLMTILAAALAVPAAAQQVTDAAADPLYETDQQWLDSVIDYEDRATGDVSEYYAEVREANRDLATGEIDADEYWEEIEQAKSLLGPNDDHGYYSPYDYGYYDPYYGYDSYYTDEYGVYDSGYEWEAEDDWWDGWYDAGL